MIQAIIITAALLVVAILIYAAALPSHFQIQRSATIKASPDKLFPLINDLHTMQTWSAWETVDPAMKRSYSGEASGKGAKYAWEGNREIGQGSMEITESTPPVKVALKLDFIKPFEGHSTVEFTLEPKGDNTVVTQTMQGTNAYIPKLMCLLFFNQDKMISDKFEQGLANLKAIAEQ
jgi:uncharacterized protein YndB with AHSA1/START domain